MRDTRFRPRVAALVISLMAGLLAMPAAALSPPIYGPQLGTGASVRVAGTGTPVISHIGSSIDSLRLLVCDDAGCLQDPETVVTLPGRPALTQTSLALDSADRAAVVAQVQLDGDSGVHLYRCGDPSCGSIDVALLPEVARVESAASLVLDPSGSPTIAWAQDGVAHVLRCDDRLCQGDSPVSTVLPAVQAAAAIDAANNVVLTSVTPDGAVMLLRCSTPTCADPAPTPVTLTADGTADGGLALVLASGGEPLIGVVGDQVRRVIGCESIACASPEVNEVGQVRGDGGSMTTAAGAVVLAHLDDEHQAVVTVCADGCATSSTTPLPVQGAFAFAIDADGGGVPVIALQSGFDAPDLAVLRCADPTCGSMSVTHPDPSGGSAGSGSDVVVGPDGSAVVASVSRYSSGLRVQRCGDPSCGQPGITVSRPDPEGRVGGDVSMVLTPAGNPVAAYFDLQTQAVKLLSCNDPACLGGDEVIRQPEAPAAVDQRISLALTAQGAPVYAYTGPEGSTVVGCDTAECTAPRVAVPRVDPSARAPEIALAADGGLWLAHRTDMGLDLIRCALPSCTTDEDLTVIAMLRPDRALRSHALVLDGDERPVVAAIDDDGVLHLARCASGDCAEAPSLATPVYDRTATGGLDIQVDGAGNPVIVTDALDGVKLLQCDDPQCEGHERSIVDVSDSSPIDADPALAITPDGDVVVTYHDLADASLATATLTPNPLPEGPEFVLGSEGQQLSVTYSGAGVTEPIEDLVLRLGVDGERPGLVERIATISGPGCSVRVRISCTIPRIEPGQPGTTLRLEVVPVGVTPVRVIGPEGSQDVPPLPITDPVDTAIRVSQQRFADGPDVGFGNVARAVVLASAESFADSLAGAVLTRNSPLLLTAPDTLDPRTEAEILRLTGGGGDIFILGGERAISEQVEEALSAEPGHTIVRLGGATRIETALAIAEAAADQNGAQDVLVVRSDGPADSPTAAWADAVTVGAWSARSGRPVLLTPTSSAHTEVREWLGERPDLHVTVIGGEAAVSSEVEAELGASQRIAGPTRSATAVAIADDLWGDGITGHLLAPGDADDGWAYALAIAGLAADLNRPVLLTRLAGVPAETRAALCESGLQDRAVLVSPAARTSPDVASALAEPC